MYAKYIANKKKINCCTYPNHVARLGLESKNKIKIHLKYFVYSFDSEENRS
jgi:hypothetical protein